LISRRSFLHRTLAGGLVGGALHHRLHAAPGQLLYNGIRLGTPWPPSRQYPDEFPVRPPYLTNPPAVIPIDVGRQLFVDDFLIEHTTMVRSWHQPVYHAANPILRPEKAWELADPVAGRTNKPLNPAAMVFSDGVFYDPRDRVFKMWYMAGYGAATCLALSDDGVTWRRPDFGVVSGTNIVNTDVRDSSTVWLDLETADPQQRYKMSIWHDHALLLYRSPDGIHWTKFATSGRSLDRSTFFYNPFRKVWVFSLRANQFESSISGRYRKYWEAPLFEQAARWDDRDPVAWVKADASDWARPGMPSPAELYNLDCVAYESVMLGLFSIWRGESNVREKINEVTTGFSRDGFHWDRDDRQTFIPVSEQTGSWNWANIQTAGGGCLIVGDEIYFYVSGRQGDPGTERPGVCSTGLARLRRDGFASMDWAAGDWRVRRGDGAEGVLTTRPVTFSGGHLFVNADLGDGELSVEVLDRDGRAIAGFDRQSCLSVRGGGTQRAVRWTSAQVASLAGRPVRFRFSMTRGRLYAFWLSSWPTGESRGFTAAGGPGLNSPADLPVSRSVIRAR
jgi:hypothetical protein